MYIEIVTSLLTILTLCWLFIKRKYNYWNSCGIDSVAATFPFGSLKKCFLLKRNIGETFADFYRQYSDKKFVGFYGPLDPMLLVRDPDLIRTILVKDFNSFGDSGFTVYKEVDPLLGYNPFGERGLERWKNSRAVTSPAFGLSRVKTMSVHVIKAAENFTKYIDTKIGEPLDMKSLTRYFLIDAVVSSGFGIESNSFSDENNSFREFTKGEMFSNNSDANYAALSAMFLPFASKIFGWRTLSKKLEKLFIGMHKSCTDHRKKNYIAQLDLLQHLINLNVKAEQENRKPFTDVEIASHCVALYGDGVDTANLVMPLAIYYIANDSEVQEKLRTEIDNSIKDFEELDFDKLQSFEYLDMVLSEIFRLHPAVPFLSRTCTRTTDLDKLTIYPGTKIFIPTLALHMDPKYYPEPEKFQPERFSKENRADLHKFVYLPFSEGPRMCSGFRYAQTEIKIGLAALLKKYRFSLANGIPRLHNDESTVFLLSVKEDIHVIFSPI